MKLNSTKYLLTITLCASLILSCGKKDDSQPETNSENKTASTENETLKFADKNFVKSVNDCSPSDTCVYFKVNYIEAVSGKIKDKLNKFIIEQVLRGVSYGDEAFPSIQAAADTFTVSYSEFRKEFPESAQYWAYEYYIKQINETPALLCLEAGNYSFMGGAHPNSYLQYINVNKETGDTVSLAGIFKPGFETELNGLIDAKYREANGLKPGDNLQDKGGLFENKITFNYNYTITKNGGVEFYYNPYEIAPYAAGNIIITFTKEKLKNIINTSGPLK